MKNIPDNTIDLIVCDLPYGTTANKWDSVIPFEPLWEAYRRVLTPTGVVALTASQPFTSALVMSNPKMFKHEWIWIKNRGSNFLNTVREPMKEHESVLVFSNGKWTFNKQMQERSEASKTKIGQTTTYSTRTTNYGDVSDQTVVVPELRVPASWQKFSAEVGFHPTQKPVGLMEYIIKTYSNKGDHVLDNCMGSGTTGVACMNTGRVFTGIELNQPYFEVATQRIREAAHPMGNTLFDVF